MAYQSFFYNSKNGDRKYRAEQMAALMAALVTNGVYANPADCCMALAGTGMTVNLSPGRLWINGYCTVITAPEPLTIPAAHATLPRIDRIVARLDLTQRTTLFAVVEGTAAASPTASDLIRTDEIWELGLATVSVAAGATAITDAEITDTRPEDIICGYVTGVIDQIKLGQLYAQHRAIFDAFMAELEYVLDGDVAGHLLNLITETQKIAMEASIAIRKNRIGGL